MVTSKAMGSLKRPTPVQRRGEHSTANDPFGRKRRPIEFFEDKKGGNVKDVGRSLLHEGLKMAIMTTVTILG